MAGWAGPPDRSRRQRNPRQAVVMEGSNLALLAQQESLGFEQIVAHLGMKHGRSRTRTAWHGLWRLTRLRARGRTSRLKSRKVYSLALHSVSGPSPQPTNARCARGEEFERTEFRVWGQPLLDQPGTNDPRS